MKRIITVIVVLVVLCAGSLTAFFIAKNKQDNIKKKNDETTADYALFSFDTEAVNKVTFEIDGQTYTTELTDSKWRFTDNDEFEARHYYVQNVCTYMSVLTAEKDYGKADEADLATYGLDDPVVITASDGTNEYVLYVGDQSPTGDYYYVMTADKDKIYAINSLNGGVLQTNRDMLKNANFLPYDTNEVNRIKLVKDGETVYDLTQDTKTGSWTLSDISDTLTVNSTAASTMLTIMVRLEAQEFFEENLQDYSVYGFDNPDATMTIETSDGKTHTTLFSYNGMENPVNVYALNEETGQVVTYLAYDADFIEDTPAEFIVKRLCTIGSYNITGFDFTLGEEKSTFTVDMNNSLVECDNSSISALGEEGMAAFENFYNSFSFIEFSQLDTSASAPDTSELVMSINFHENDGNTTLVEYFKKDDDFCYAFINGEYTETLVSMEDITGIRSVSEFYTGLKELIS